MTEVLVNSTDDLIRLLNELPNHYIYRGHADASWKLESSLERVIGNSWSSENAEKFESFSLDQFCPKFHLYDFENVAPTSKLAWLSLMQHYGVPTRLIDFTESPYVALYFALEAYNPQSKRDLAIFALDYTSVMKHSIEYIGKRDSNFKETPLTIPKKQDEVFENIVDRFAYEIAWVTEPKQLNARLDRQAGCFLLSGNKGVRIESILNMDTYKNCTLKKFVVAHELYSGIFALLRKMNITSKSIYGDLDGLARSIKMQMQIYSAK